MSSNRVALADAQTNLSIPITDVFQCKLRAEFIHCKNLFYQQLLEYWFDLYSIQPETFKDILVEPLWFNVCIIVGGSPIFYRQWWSNNIRWICDIFNWNGTKKTVLPSNITVDELPDAIYRFFIEKIKQIQKEFVLDDSLDTHEQGIAPHKEELKTFRPATEDEVREVLKQTAKKSCCLDPIPAFLLMECTEELLPVITRIINLSLSTSHVPRTLKTAVVTPVLKKLTAGPDELTNFRPVSNLPFIVKLLEKVVSRHLKDHKTENELYERTQSAYRAGHSTETALLKVQNDILRAIDTGHCVFLVLLDLSVTFDTIAHHILLERMKTKFGVVKNAHEWLASYLKDRTQSVSVSGSSSSPVPLTCGVPQGSVLGPDLFSDYSSPAAAIIRSFKVSVQCYADDTHLYRAFTPGEDELEVLGQMEQCISELRNWISRNMLKLNDDKAEGFFGVFFFI